MKTINTGIDAIDAITQLSRSTAVISGDEDDMTKVKSYNLHNGTELSSVNHHVANGVAGVKLDGNLALAVSCRLVKGGISFKVVILLSELKSLRLLKLNF